MNICKFVIVSVRTPTGTVVVHLVYSNIQSKLVNLIYFELIAAVLDMVARKRDYIRQFYVIQQLLVLGY